MLIIFKKSREKKCPFVYFNRKKYFQYSKNIKPETCLHEKSERKQKSVKKKSVHRKIEKITNALEQNKF